jgi:hypothetical protein
MAEVHEEKVNDGGPYYPIPAAGCSNSGISVRDKVAKEVFVDVFARVFSEHHQSEVAINAKDIAVEAFAAADAFLKTRAIV